MRPHRHEDILYPQVIVQSLPLGCRFLDRERVHGEKEPGVCDNGLILCLKVEAAHCQVAWQACPEAFKNIWARDLTKEYPLGQHTLIEIHLPLQGSFDLKPENTAG